MRIAPTGKKVFLTACTVTHMKDGKIADEWMYTDQSALLEQLGVL
jgi:predicted ester cyclase